MGYSPNNPLVPGDPYSYDLKWIVEQIKAWKDPEQSAAEAKASAELAADKAADALASANAAAATAADLDAALYYVTPQMFGAVGDGVADDTAAIISAISSGKPVFVPAGTYRITSKISLTSNVAIIGFNTPIFRWDNYNDWFFGGQNISNIIVNGICFDFGTQINLNHSISLLQTEHVYFINCEITGGFGYATRLNESKDVHFVRCRFHDITGASGNPGGGIYGIDTQNIYVTGCSFEDLTDHAIYFAGNNGASDLFVENCYIYNTGTAGLTNGAAIALYALCKNIQISGCNIDTCRTGIYIGIYGGYAGTPENVFIKNVIIEGITLQGITMQGSALYPIEQIYMSDVIITTAGEDGITARYVNRSTFEGINISAAIRYAFDLNGSNDNIIQNTRLNTAGLSSNALIVGRNAASNRNVITNIMCDGSGSNCVYMRSGDNNRFFNIIEDTTNFSTPSIFGGLNNSYINAMLNTSSIFFSSAAPSGTSYHNKGEICFNSNAASGSPKGWICTAAGSPGTWVSLGNL